MKVSCGEMSIKIKKISNRNKEEVKFLIIKKFNNLAHKPLLRIGLGAVIINFILEMLNKRSLFGGLIAIVDHPLMFIYNILIILLTLLIATLFKRKYFLIFLVSLLWISLAIINFIVLGFRTTPLTGPDIINLFSMIEIVPIYMNNLQIVLIIVSILVVISFIFYVFKKLPKSKVEIKKVIIITSCTGLLLLGISNFTTKSNTSSGNFGNIADAYQGYGFAYCFAASLVERGIEKPNPYNVKAVEVVMNDISKEDANPAFAQIPGDNISGKSPNIVIIQLESFFDVNNLLNVEFSENPIPNFSKLEEEYSSGLLTVPTVGSGTANTEFEIITGMSHKFFGPGEYPYNTVLKEATVESICYNLSDLGYHSHAIHNNTATFYNRNTVYPNLGFDSFSSIEYMNNIEYNPIGWAKDKILTSEIMTTLNATTEQDFIFTVSVQPHGKYPDTVIDEDQFITVTGDLEDSEICGYEYFANQLYEEDAFIADLIEKLDNFSEPTVLVLYGDHLPSMGINNEDLVNNDVFQTPYVLWSNFPLEEVDKDITAYQMNAYIMERLGYDNGILTKFHQRNSELLNYQEELQLLQYDMLYGDCNVFDGINPYIKKEMTMGIEKIKIKECIQSEEAIFIKGSNFTKWSEVYVNNDAVDTLFIDQSTLIIASENIENIENMENLYVAQVSDKGKVLSKSDSIIDITEQREIDSKMYNEMTE